MQTKHYVSSRIPRNISSYDPLIIPGSVIRLQDAYAIKSDNERNKGELAHSGDYEPSSPGPYEIFVPAIYFIDLLIHEGSLLLLKKTFMVQIGSVLPIWKSASLFRKKMHLGR
jgi:hypothetical protein